MTAAVEHVLLHECEGVTESPIFQFFRGDNSASTDVITCSTDNNCGNGRVVISKIGSSCRGVLRSAEDHYLAVFHIEHEFAKPVFFVDSIKCDIESGYLTDYFTDLLAF